eukprot:UN02434
MYENLIKKHIHLKPNIIILNLLIHAAGILDLKQGLAVYNTIIKNNIEPNQNILGTLMKISFHHKQPDLALKFYEDFSKRADMKINISHYLVLFKGLKSHDKLDKALELFNHLPDDQKKDYYVYNTLISGFEDKLDYTSALSLWKHCLDKRLSDNQAFYEQGIRLGTT